MNKDDLRMCLDEVSDEIKKALAAMERDAHLEMVYHLGLATGGLWKASDIAMPEEPGK